MKVITEWKGNMLFKAHGKNGYAVMDASGDVGGQESAPSPKEMILAGLAGCTGMDVVSILKKMRALPEKMDIVVEASLAEEFPKPFTSFTVLFRFWGDALDREKIHKAVTLSHEKYCGVSATLSRAAALDFRIELNP
jgi:putative redox protein